MKIEFERVRFYLNLFRYMKKLGTQTDTTVTLETICPPPPFAVLKGHSF